MTFVPATGVDPKFGNNIKDKIPDTFPTITQPRAVLVYPFEFEEVTSSGLYIPKKTRTDIETLSCCGVVLSVNPKDAPFKAGDVVSWQKFNGQKFFYNDKDGKKSYRMIILDYEDIMMKLDSFSDIDPFIAQKNLD